ncbi:MAG: TRAFAC clade GTPase domain-containing protein [Flavobacterium sp.]|uniref:TRAFAC clade GTPase domain-containing protein n=1 Tax=Flavobacterium sp. TaxID=239 RepID=UPI003BE81572
MSLSQEQKIILTKFNLENNFDLLEKALSERILSLEICKSNDIEISKLLEVVSNIILKGGIKESILEIEGLHNVFNENQKCKLSYLHLNQLDIKSENFERILRRYVDNRLIYKDFIVLEKKMIDEKRYNQIFRIELGPSIVEAVKIYREKFNDLPEPGLNKTNIFVIGLVGSGKTVLTIALFNYLFNRGLYEFPVLGNNIGKEIIEDLMGYFREGHLAPATPESMALYVSANIKSKSNQTIPINFFDLSGEIFQQSKNKNFSDMPHNFRKYLEHDNNKVFLFTIDYQSVNTAFRQATTLTSILTSLKEAKVLNYTISICLVITKWDCSGLTDQSFDIQKEHAHNFLNSHYLQLKNLCAEYSSEFGFEFKIFPFSLGMIDKYDQTINFNYVYTENLYNWISTFPIKKTNNSNNFLGKLFSSNK